MTTRPSSHRATTQYSYRQAPRLGLAP